MAFLKKMYDMLSLMEVLELDKLQTVEEIAERIFVDFSTLPLGIPEDEELRAKVLFNLHVDDFRLKKKLRRAVESVHLSDHTKFDIDEFNYGIAALGVDNFLAAAAQFCEEEAAGGGIDILSVGSGEGTIERFIMAEYRSRYGKDLPRIKLVDPDPAFEDIVDFKTVDHLIEERPNMVGNCVAFIIWPLPGRSKPEAADGNEPYDIEAVRKLQPRAVFVVYEYTGSSGSVDFRMFLRDEKLETVPPDEVGIQNWLYQSVPDEKKTSYGLDEYKIIELGHQKVTLQMSGTYIYRMVKLVREESESGSSDLMR